LDSVADDVESFAHILMTLSQDCSSGNKNVSSHVERSELVQSLSRLVSRDLVAVYAADSGDGSLSALPSRALPVGDFSRSWFKITPRGLLLHANWASEGD